ncbi:hypothetical protein [Rubritalea tangerina]|uniref:hypothetical protein n=1 Tax=Rubritalea tangerina TaxID=430798 RepID=UPI0036221F5D
MPPPQVISPKSHSSPHCPHVPNIHPPSITYFPHTSKTTLSSQLVLIGNQSRIPYFFGCASTALF